MVIKQWQDRVIYFILIDRFCNGDKSNDDLGVGEFDARDDQCFQGGDLKGITSKIPYIKKLGFDAVWITPPTYNQWINPATSTRGYHGYWPYDFTMVDPHFGTLEDYKTLVRTAHRHGIKVIQDIVVNHTGNYFTVDAEGYDPAFPQKNWRSLDGAYPPSMPPKAPRDPVFSMNNPNDPKHKAAGVYNFAPSISDFNDREQTLNYTLGDLDDINLNSPLAIERLKRVYRYWIKEVGVDGFRVDTVYYTPEKFYERFLYDRAAGEPGVKSFAQSLGKKDFFVFGEVWSYDYRAINRYVREKTVPRLDSAIDFPLNEALVDVFFRKAATEKMRAALEAVRTNGNLWVNFIDNHDVERAFSRAGEKAVQQALAALFTLPGIPCVYYGTERKFRKLRQNMFAANNYRAEGSFYSFIKELIRLRRKHRLFSRGSVKVLRASNDSGLLVYEVRHRAERAIVVFNTSMQRLYYGLPEGRWRLLHGSKMNGEGAGGALIVDPSAYHVLGWEGAAKPSNRNELSGPSLISARAQGAEAISIRYRAKDAGRLFLMADGNYDRRIPVPAASNGLYSFDARSLGNGDHRLALLAMERAGVAASRELLVRISHQPRLLIRRSAPTPGRHGVYGNVRPPADASYQGQMDIKKASVFSIGPDIELVLEMASMTNDWNAPTGYDHVYFSVFFDIPKTSRKGFLPKLKWRPKDFRFRYGVLFYGWGIVSFSSRDSTPEDYGAPLPYKIEQESDRPRRTVRFRFPGKMFEPAPDFSGVKILVSTWDGYLGQFHEIAPKKEDWAFSVRGPMSPRKVPKVYSHMVITLG